VARRNPVPTGSGKTIESNFAAKGKCAQLYLRILEDLRTLAQNVRAHYSRIE
jgi:hypothetical protein